LVWEYSPEPVKLARKTADMAGGVPMMMHITDSPIPLPELLAHMKPGDIVTRCYHGRAHGIMGQEKQVILREVVEAQRHGIIFDCAHGRNHFSFPMIEKALDQGFLPDTISTDLTFTSATNGPVFDLPTTMSKLLNFANKSAAQLRGLGPFLEQRRRGDRSTQRAAPQRLVLDGHERLVCSHCGSR
jgi:dihydroorotase